MDLTFALLREGTSDDGLIPHLQVLLVRAGATSAVGASRPYGGAAKAKLDQVLAEEGLVDLVFFHVDADGDDPQSRRANITKAAAALTPNLPCVPLIPVHELEAWLLVDPAAIRAVVGRPADTSPLDLPKLAQIETTPSPKEILMKALLVASATSGRRREKEKKRFAQRRRSLLERLDLDGPLASLTSFKQLVDDVEQAVQLIASR